MNSKAKREILIIYGSCFFIGIVLSSLRYFGVISWWWSLVTMPIWFPVVGFITTFINYIWKNLKFQADRQKRMEGIKNE